MGIISTRSRYGLRFLADMASQGRSGPIDIGSIAARQCIPEKYLAKLAIPLKSAGLVRSSRGAHGGYVLTKQPESIDLLTLVEVLEGSSSLLSCTGSPETCARSSTCKARNIWMGLEKTIRDYLKGVTVADVMETPSAEYSI